MNKLPFPLQNSVPPRLKDLLLDFWWDLDKLHALELPEINCDMVDFLFYLDLPYWQYKGEPFRVAPRDVLEYPDKYHEQHTRTLHADLQHPIIIFKRENQPTIILDGVHRLLKAHMLGLAEIRVKLFSEEQIPLILHARD